MWVWAVGQVLPTADRGACLEWILETKASASQVMQFDFETKTWTQHKAHGPNSTKPLPIFIEV